jgi:hypothetical protein
MRGFFRMILTGRDNETYEIARVLLFIGFFSLILFAAIDVFVSAHPFDALNYSMGLTGLLFGGSGGIAIKEHSEPKDKDDGLTR